MSISIPAMIILAMYLFTFGSVVRESVEALGQPYHVTQGRQFDWMFTALWIGAQVGLLWWGGFFDVEPLNWTAFA